jgi:hypothetical protein
MKRTISIFLCLALMAMLVFNFRVSASVLESDDMGLSAIAGSTENAVTMEKGDVNNDAKVNDIDFEVIKMHILGFLQLSGDALEKADVDASGSVDALDLAAIKKYLLGIQ